jgi:hypothetical protein
MKSTLIALVVAARTLAAPGEWRVGESAVRVICPMTVGGSFDVKTAALSESMTASPGGSSYFDGSLAVDLRTLDSGIDLRNEHLRTTYLEVDRWPNYQTATVSAIDLIGLNLDAPDGKGSFTIRTRCPGDEGGQRRRRRPPRRRRPAGEGILPRHPR